MKSLSRVQLFMTPWTIAYHAPPSMGFSRQEYWSGLPFPKARAFCRIVLLHSLSLAIPQFRLLSHVSSLRLPLGHSGPVLSLSNAAHHSPFSPRLLVVDASIWDTSLVGVAFRQIICGFFLFIFLPSYVALQDSKTSPDLPVRGFLGVWKLLLY